MNATKTINATTNQCYNTSNEYYDYYYGHTSEESMDIPLHSYMYTLFLGIGCYSFLNPTHFHTMMVNLGFWAAEMLLSGFIIYNENIYKPFNRYVYKPLVYILNIQENRDEIIIVKDGIIIHSFATMEDFIKQKPINFIRDKADDQDSEDSEDSKEEEAATLANDSEATTTSTMSSTIPSTTIDTVIDADLTNMSTDIHTSGDDADADAEETEETEEMDDSDDSVDSDEDDDFILDPSEYDFLLRNLYYENDEEYERYNICFKYETFCKSDLKKVYTNDEMKSQVSKRKLIGANLHMNSKKYVINLTTPINYFTVDNSVLGYHFLKWYMAENHDIILNKKYSVLCIDNCIGMYELVPGKKLLVSRDSLKVVDDDEYSGEDSDSEETGDDAEQDNAEQTEHTEQAEKSDQSNDTCDIEVVDCD